MLQRMKNLRDKIAAKAEMQAAVAELAEEKTRPKAKSLKVRLKVGVKKLKK